MLVSISKAAVLAGISRPHLYNKYINTGALSVDKSDPKKPQIDTAELLRVFGNLNYHVGEAFDAITGDNSDLLRHLTPETAAETVLLRQQVELLKQQLADKDGHIEDLRRALQQIEHKPTPDTAAAERERLLLAQVENLTDVVKRLELQSQQPPPQPRRGFIARLLGRG